MCECYIIPWIPYKVADEFHRNRVSCISDQKKAYTSIISALDKVSNDFSSRLNKYKQHKIIDIKDYKKRLNDFISKEIKRVNKAQEQHPDYIKTDNILSTISAIFDGKVGNNYEEKKLSTLYEEGEIRYSKKIPPGYMDTDKSDNYRLYGDLIIWKDIISKSQESKKPIIFVTSDNKEDWWHEHDGKTLGPRPELIQEFRHETKQSIYIYNPAPFIKYASRFLNRTTNDNILDEIESVRTSQHSEYYKINSQSWDPIDIEKFEHNLKFIDSQPETGFFGDLIRRDSLYLEERKTLQKRINRLQTQIRTIADLIDSGVSDEDQEELEAKRNRKSASLLNLQYNMHTLDDHIIKNKDRIRKTEQNLSLSIGEQEEPPF